LKLAKAIQNKRRRARDCMAAYFMHISIIYCADYTFVENTFTNLWSTMIIRLFSTWSRLVFFRFRSPLLTSYSEKESTSSLSLSSSFKFTFNPRDNDERTHGECYFPSTHWWNTRRLSRRTCVSCLRASQRDSYFTEQRNELVKIKFWHVQNVHCVNALRCCFR